MSRFLLYFRLMEVLQIYVLNVPKIVNFLFFEITTLNLHYFLKGGVIYAFLIFIFLILIILHTFRNSKSNYLTYLSLILSFYLMFSTIENTPIFGPRSVSIWIIIAICASSLFVKLDDNEIGKLINTESKDV